MCFLEATSPLTDHEHGHQQLRSVADQAPLPRAYADPHGRAGRAIQFIITLNESYRHLAVDCSQRITVAQNRRPPKNTAATKLVQVLKEQVRPEQAHKDVETIWRTDRWFTFPKFEETAKNVATIDEAGRSGGR